MDRFVPVTDPWYPYLGDVAHLGQLREGTSRFKVGVDPKGDAVEHRPLIDGEFVEVARCLPLRRYKIPGGWLVRTALGAGHRTLVFVADPKHEWAKSPKIRADVIAAVHKNTIAFADAPKASAYLDKQEAKENSPEEIRELVTTEGYVKWRPTKG